MIILTPVIKNGTEEFIDSENPIYMIFLIMMIKSFFVNM